MKKFSKYIGLDVHKATIAVSVADGNSSEIRFMGEIPNTTEALEKLIKQLRKGVESLSFCYEAGPCGYNIHRQITDLGWDCQVIAPSLIPKKAGDRVKTDRRDSVMLAKLHRAGELTAIWVPDQVHEALRDITRAREDMKHLQRQAKQRLQAFLLRHHQCYSGKSNWTQAHFRWMETVKFAQPVQQIVFQEYIDTVKTMTTRIASLDRHIESNAHESIFWPTIEALMALRGIDLLSAVVIVAEIGDIKRFTSAPQLMAYLGLVPSEHSSGGKVRRGGITKTGNSHVRRVLVEAAWSYRFAARKTKHLERRAERTSERVQAVAWTGQKRLCGRYQALNARGKLKVQVCTAVARELAGFVWAIAQAMPTPSAQ